MGWGRRAAGPRTSELERLAAEAERLYLGMPEADRDVVLESVSTMVRAGAGLQALPEELAEVLGKIAMKFLLELHMPKLPGRKAQPGRLVEQLAAGAPRLLGPHRAALADWLADG